MDTIIELLEAQSIYVVLIITLIVWLGLFIYIFGVDKKLKKLEEEK